FVEELLARLVEVAVIGSLDSESSLLSLDNSLYQKLDVSI
ncbi:42266_t:CDS:1, partial [Gigaspora margarita]